MIQAIDREDEDRGEECCNWRPLALKGICRCGKRFHQHPKALQARLISERDASVERLNTPLKARQGGMRVECATRAAGTATRAC